MLERNFQGKLIKEIKSRFDGCIVLKNDAGYKQGIPDLLILYKSNWAALECKKDKNSSKRPNQDYYVAKMNDMSFAAFIYPENMEVVLNDMERSLRSDRNSCRIQSE